MAHIHMNKEEYEGDHTPRIDLHKRITSLETKVKDARHHAEEWEQVAVRIGKERLDTNKKLADEKRHRLYERIGWLLLSISLALAPHL